MIKRICAFALVLGLLAGCGKEEPRSKPDMSRLPKKVDILPLGKVDFISPKDLLDKLNSGERPALYFLQDLASSDQSLMIPLPGMKIVNIGEASNVVLKLPKSTPIYLICMFGDDSKRMGKELAKEGYNCFYVDGGSFNLINQTKKNGWRIPTQ